MSKEKISKIILNKTLKPNQIVSEREMNLMKKIKKLENRISQIYSQKNDQILKMNEENKRLKYENERLKVILLQNKKISLNKGSDIKEYKNRFNIEDDEKKIKTLKKVIDNI